MSEQTMPNDNVLTDEQRTIAWNEYRKKCRDEHDELPDIADFFAGWDAALLAAHPGQPEPRVEVTDDDKLCAERYRWLRERAWYVDAATYALELRERWRSGNEPPPDVDEVECALDAARTQGSKS
ncbi:hypothetical protein [Burkholderia pseudomallei]|uniref:hypothetical protein n=1 Tax=Burkholderia pseudomallei TaxID=28450 RepID=UPI0028C4ABA5|nr:hypothetical protein [Burkholderia pseudomallei]